MKPFVARGAWVPNELCFILPENKTTSMVMKGRSHEEVAAISKKINSIFRARVREELEALARLVSKNLGRYKMSHMRGDSGRKLDHILAFNQAIALCSEAVSKIDIDAFMDREVPSEEEKRQD